MWGWASGYHPSMKTSLLRILATAAVIACGTATPVWSDTDDPNEAPPLEGVDNMYPTVNANWTCVDGSMSIGVFCRTDDYYVSTHNQDNVRSSTATAINLTWTNNYAATDLQRSVHYTQYTSTDIVYQDGVTPGNGDVIGITWCRDATSTRVCGQHYVRFSNDYTINQYVTCHETGHAVGLTHGQEAYPKVSNSSSLLGCMRTPYYPGTPALLGPMNIANINSAY